MLHESEWQQTIRLGPLGQQFGTVSQTIVDGWPQSDLIRYIETRRGEEISMDDAVAESLIFDLLEWVANGERSYEEVIDAWRTSCPRFPVWEDANDRGLVMREEVNGRCIVRITSSGRALLELRRSSPRSRAEGRGS